jgi:putative ubiquitin-RnfH superfamily antitoxin RatB of RatAB toxin-antitoxin module
VTEQTIDVEVAYARTKAQALLPVKGEPGMTLQDAIECSGILERFPEIDLGVNKVGIFGKVAKLDQPLQNGDRVEIYPPLIADPKQARKQRAADAKPTRDRAAAQSAN